MLKRKALFCINHIHVYSLFIQFCPTSSWVSAFCCQLLFDSLQISYSVYNLSLSEFFGFCVVEHFPPFYLLVHPMTFKGQQSRCCNCIRPTSLEKNIPPLAYQYICPRSLFTIADEKGKIPNSDTLGPVELIL